MHSSMQAISTMRWPGLRVEAGRLRIQHDFAHYLACRRLSAGCRPRRGGRVPAPRKPPMIARRRRMLRPRSNPVGTTKSARRRFSASGICCFRIAAKRALGHSRPPHHPLALQHRRCGDHDHIVATPGAAAFVQQGYVEDGDRLAAGAGAGQKPLLGRGDHRVQNRLRARRAPRDRQIRAARAACGRCRRSPRACRGKPPRPLPPPHRPAPAADEPPGRRRTAALRSAAASPRRCFSPSRSSR